MFARTTHPNGRSKHWSIKAESVKLQRENAYWSARVKVGEPWTKDKLTEARIEFEFVVARRHDADNLLAWCKPSIDGFVDYGILSDDRYVEVFACQRLAKKGETAHVVARIGKKKSSLASP